LRENPDSGPDGIGVQADHAYTLEARAEVQAVAFALRGREGGAMPEVGGDQAGALRAASGGSSRDYVAFNITPSNSNKDYNARPSDRAQALTAGGNRPSARGGDLIAGSAVRRLTPRECERLQGFPDDYTLIPWRKGEAADGPRYKALGNSMAVPVMAWLGRRIAEVEALPERRVA
jgi:DNA (cytosine-5)-methyltransferase 1